MKICIYGASSDFIDPNYIMTGEEPEETINQLEKLKKKGEKLLSLKDHCESILKEA